jgi:hypothetical protein
VNESRGQVTGDPAVVADGIIQIPSKERKYNCVVVRQSDGIVIIEAPYSRGNSEFVLEQVKRSYPGLTIKALVTTSQMWIHVAGVQAYAQKGVPIYALDTNADLVRSFADADSDSRDSGKRQPPLNLRVVRKATEIGSGQNRLIIYPFKGRASARMLAVYLPERKMLYASDMYLPQAFGGDYWLAYLAEVRDLIGREHLDVDRVMGIHMPPASWKDLAARLVPKE